MFLKTRMLIESKERTRIEPFPAGGATDDLDFFLQTQIVTNINNFKAIRNVLNDDYKPIESAKYYQFGKKEMISGLPKPIKIDLLASPPETAEGKDVTDVDSRRIKPKGSDTELHARRCDEAVFVERTAIEVELTDADGDGAVEVFVPHPFAYLFLKLNALSDGITDQRKAEKAPKHAFDIYRIVAMTTEFEWKESLDLAQKEEKHNEFIKASEIVSRLFVGDNPEGVRLIKSYSKEPLEPDTNALIEDLKELFLRGES